MKKLISIILLSILTFPIVACNLQASNGMQPNLDQNQVYTAAAQTIETTLTLGALFDALNKTSTPMPMDASETPGIPPTLAPTETPINTPLPSDTPSPSMTNTPSTPMIHATTNTNCRSGPSGNYDVVGYLTVGDLVQVLGRISNNSWWNIQNPDDLQKNCWVWAQTTVVDGNLSAIPIITPAPSPTPDSAEITVSSSAAPINYTGACPVNIVLTGNIKSTLPETVTYKWASDIPYPFTAKDVTFDSAGLKTFSETMVISSTRAGYVRFRVYSPYEVKADRIDLVINCVP